METENTLVAQLFAQCAVADIDRLDAGEIAELYLLLKRKGVQRHTKKTRTDKALEDVNTVSKFRRKLQQAGLKRTERGVQEHGSLEMQTLMSGESKDVVSLRAKPTRPRARTPSKPTGDDTPTSVIATWSAPTSKAAGSVEEPK